MAYGLGIATQEGNTVTASDVHDLANALVQRGMSIAEAEKRAKSAALLSVVTGDHVLTINGIKYLLKKPPKPTAALADGMEWKWDIPSWSWQVGKKGGGLLGGIVHAIEGIGKTAITVAPIAAFAIPGVGPALGIGAGALKGAASVAGALSTAGDVLHAGQTIVHPGTGAPMVTPGTFAPFPPSSVVPPGQPVVMPLPGTVLPGWLIPVGVGLGAMLLLNRGTR